MLKLVLLLPKGPIWEKAAIDFPWRPIGIVNNAGRCDKTLPGRLLIPNRPLFRRQPLLLPPGPHINSGTRIEHVIEIVGGLFPPTTVKTSPGKRIHQVAHFREWYSQFMLIHSRSIS